MKSKNEYTPYMVATIGLGVLVVILSTFFESSFDNIFRLLTLPSNFLLIGSGNFISVTILFEAFLLISALTCLVLFFKTKDKILYYSLFIYILINAYEVGLILINMLT